MRKEILLVAVAVGLSLCLGECALRVVAPVEDPYEHVKWPRGRSSPEFIESQFDRYLRVSFEIEPGLPGMTGTNTFTTNNAGFRGDRLHDPKPDDEFRIFMVGGSTTEGLVLDDPDAVTRVLQKELARRIPEGPTFKVYNAGKTGDRSDDHVAMITQRLLLLEPDMIIVFAGINDLRAAMYRVDFRHYGYDIHDEEGDVALSRPAPYRLGFWSLLRLAAYELQIGRRLYFLFHQPSDPVATSLVDMDDATLDELVATAAARGRALTTDYRVRVQRARTAQEAQELPRVDLTAYRSNMTTVVSAVRAHDVKLLLMTQQTTWNSQADPGIAEWQWMHTVGFLRYDVEVMEAAMEQYNDVVRGLAREWSVPLYDVARDLPKSREYFYDDVHFNVKGARTAAERLAELIASEVEG